jgi:hypothetical protein
VEEVRVEIGGRNHPLGFSDDELFVRSNALDIEPEIDGPQSKPRREQKDGSPSPASGDEA